MASFGGCGTHLGDTARGATPIGRGTTTTPIHNSRRLSPPSRTVERPEVTSPSTAVHIYTAQRRETSADLRSVLSLLYCTGGGQSDQEGRGQVKKMK